MASLVIQGGTLIDATGKPPLSDAVVVIEGEKIKTVGRKAETAVPKGSKIIDVQGKTILPGFIDGHCHLFDFMGELCLHLGITTCPDIVENEDYYILAQKDGVQKGKIRAPRIWAAGARLVAPPPEWAQRGFVGHVITTPEEARNVVRRKKEMGLDIIKISEYVAPEVFRAAVEEANRLDLPVTCHTLDVFWAADSGVAGVEHHWAPGMTSIADTKKRWQAHEDRMSGKYDTSELPYYYDVENFDRIIEVMVEKNVSWCPTIATWLRPLSPSISRFKARELSILNSPNTRYFPPAVKAFTLWLHDRYEKYSPDRLKKIREGYNKIEEFMRRFIKAGGILKAGSDPNHGMPALGLHQEMTMMVEAGLSPMQAIQAGTINVARAYHKAKNFGSVEPGKVADLAIVDGDPLKDIWATQNVKMVVLNGKVADIGFHANYKNPIPGSQPYMAFPNRPIEILPGAIPLGTGPTKLKVTARRGFQAWHRVKLNGKELKTRFVSSRELEAIVPRDATKKVGTHTVTVDSPNEFNSRSLPAYLIVSF
jgi:amidohydrolase family protein